MKKYTIVYKDDNIIKCLSIASSFSEAQGIMIDYIMLNFDSPTIKEYPLEGDTGTVYVVKKNKDDTTKYCYYILEVGE